MEASGSRKRQRVIICREISNNTWNEIFSVDNNWSPVEKEILTFFYRRGNKLIAFHELRAAISTSLYLIPQLYGVNKKLRHYGFPHIALHGESRDKISYYQLVMYAPSLDAL